MIPTKATKPLLKKVQGILYRLVLAEPKKREGQTTKYGWRKIEREVIEMSLGLR